MIDSVRKQALTTMYAMSQVVNVDMSMIDE